MSFPNDFPPQPYAQPSRQHATFDDFAYDSATRSASARGLTATDLLVVAGFAVFAFLAFEDFVSDSNAAGRVPVMESPRQQQICSDEELRHMRGGRAACFDLIVPPQPQADTTLGSYQSS